MRWFWIDRFEKFVAGEEATTLKNISLGEEPLDDYLPGYPHYPHSLVIEGMAQTGGLLLSQLSGFQQKVVLAKVSRADFETIAGPGDRLHLNAKLVNRQDDGAIIEGIVTRDAAEGDGLPFAKMEMTFAILGDEAFGKDSFFEPGDLCRILRSLRLFDVGVEPDGRPIEIPSHMLEAEVAGCR